MKILAVDCDPQILDELTVSFQVQWQGSRVISEVDGEAALRQFHEQDPDIVVLDSSIPGKDSFDVLREIRRTSDVPVIMLGAGSDEIDEVRGLELGADDYIVKPLRHLMLLARVKAVLRRAVSQLPGRAVPDFVAGDLTINFERREVRVQGKPKKLTPIEYKLLYHLVRNAGRLLDHQALLDRVWGPDYGATTAYLKVFISRLRAKIEPNVKGPHLIENERGIGYRFINPKDAAVAFS
jgi:two-component system KDP operon response regulator KdpE